MILFALLSCSFLWSNQRIATSMKAQQGAMTLEENFKLAKAFPEPSSWLLSNACAGCHGTNGAEMDTEIPPIAGMDKPGVDQNGFQQKMLGTEAEDWQENFRRSVFA